MSWNAATYLRRADNTIPLSEVMERIMERYGSINSDVRSVLGELGPEDRNKVFDSYVKMFNQANITRDENVATSQLHVGDTIIYTGARRYGSGEKVKVTRVAEKSIQLSNGKRIVRNYSNYKKRVTGVMKIVDDTQQPQPTTESRWIRKRII
jgi:hypothetical protein